MHGDRWIGMISNTTNWLSFAATPTFGGMALLTSVFSTPDMLCSSVHASLLSGMVPMYALMSAFHSAPWLKLISNRRSASLAAATEDQ